VASGGTTAVATPNVNGGADGGSRADQIEAAVAEVIWQEFIDETSLLAAIHDYLIEGEVDPADVEKAGAEEQPSSTSTPGFFGCKSHRGSTRLQPSRR
jgi:hypothetical protein